MFLAQTQTKHAQPLIRSMANGTIVMTSMSLLWGAVGAAGLNNWQGWFFPLAVTWIVSILLLIAGSRLNRAKKALPAALQEEETVQWNKIKGPFFLATAAEFVMMGIALGFCLFFHQIDLIFPMMAIAVGLHFFPLAPLFHMRSHYITGLLLCILPVLVLLFLPARPTISSTVIYLWWSATGYASTLVLWATGLNMLLNGYRLLHRHAPVQ